MERPFLAMVGAIISIKNGRLTLQVGEEEVEFNLFDTIIYPSFTNTVFRVDVIDELTRDVFRDETSNLSFETCLENVGKSTHANLEVAEVTCALEEYCYPPKKRWIRYEDLGKGKVL